MKKIHNLFVISLVIALLVPACGPVRTDQPDCKNVDVFCVGFVTDLEKIDDNASNQSAWAGIEQAKKDLGIEAYYIETTDSKDFEKNILTFGLAEYDLIITMGSIQSLATRQAALTFPKTLFIGIDQLQEETKPIPPNLIGLVFPEDQAGFLVGALAAQMTKSKKLGAVCATDRIPSVWRYGEGFKAGVNYIDPNLEVTVIYHNDVNNGKSFSDPEWSKITTKSLVGQGVDILFAVGGQTGNSAVLTAANNKIYAIGSEHDFYYTLQDAQNKILSSAIKLIDSSVFELIKAAKEGDFSGGANFTGKVNYAPYHDLIKKVPSDVKARMKDISSGLLDGSITTNVKPSKPESSTDPSLEPTIEPTIEPTPES